LTRAAIDMHGKYDYVQHHNSDNRVFGESFILQASTF